MTSRVDEYLIWIIQGKLGLQNFRASPQVFILFLEDFWRSEAVPGRREGKGEGGQAPLQSEEWAFVGFKTICLWDPVVFCFLKKS